MAGIRCKSGKFNSILSGRKNTIFADMGNEQVKLGDTLYIWKSVAYKHNRAGYIYTGDYVKVIVTEVTQFTKSCPPHVKF